MKQIIIAITCILFCINSNAQSRYIIKFKDKGTNPFSIANPSQYLSTRALQRRARYNITIDSLDLPVTPRYIDSIRLAGAVTVLNSSKWLNQVTIKTTDVAAIAKINSFPFVISSTAVASRSNEQEIPVNKKLYGATIESPSVINGTTSTDNITSDAFNYGASHGQVHLHQGEFLHNHGFKGEGMQLALLDAGFFRYLSLPTFDSVRLNNQILNTYDFVANENSVNEDDSHGMSCFSTIAANMPGTFVGTAPKANFCLYRTEDVASETRIEEHNLAAAYEKADSIGVDVCSISLGYTTFDYISQNYTYADMNGNTTMSAIASDIAAKKGMLPVVAAGNDGQNSWRFISTPADADSVMTVGSVDTLGNVAANSSYGPSSNGRIKPNVAATGLRAVIANPNTGLPMTGSGTSFAAPNIAGLTTCLWQAFPEYNNMAILDAMQRSASKFTSPNDRVGYGIPDMKKAFSILIKKSYTQQSTVSSCRANIQLNIKYDNTMNILIERKQSAGGTYSPVQLIAGTGSFTNKILNVNDDLSLLTTGAANYRIKLDIVGDTSFFLDSILVNYIPKPILGNDKTVSVCGAASLNLNSEFNLTGLSAVWTLAGAPVANPASVSTAGTYRVEADNASGCSDTAFLTVGFFTALNIGPDVTISQCTNSFFDLRTVINTTGLTATYTLGGIIVPNPSAVTTSGIYKLLAVNNFGCKDSALIDLQLAPKINLGRDTTVIKCPNNTYNLSALYSISGLTAMWSLNGVNVPNPEVVINSGTYQLIGSSSLGCRDTTIVKLINDPIECSVTGLLISPNPVTDNLFIKVKQPLSSMISINILNAAGQTVYGFENNQPAGSLTYTVPMKKYGKGVYFVSVTMGSNKQKTQKILVQ